MPQRYFIKLSYDGTGYHGWQTQDNSVSIQSVLNDALSVVLGEKLVTTGAGRTDAGVHAREFYLHFDLPQEMDHLRFQKLRNNLNGILPQDIAIQEVFEVPQEAHARFSAISRTYHYYITCEKDPFLLNKAYRYSGHLEMEVMNEGAKCLLETSDFTSFAKMPYETKTNICKVTLAEWMREGNQLVFVITADRFLRNMVRAIVGTLIDLGRGKLQLEDIKRIIDSKDRGAAGYSVPACGLYLTSVEYPRWVFTK